MTQGKAIYVNGDSFTQGCDTADILLPFPSKNFSINQLRAGHDDSLIQDQHKFISLKNEFLKNNYDYADEYYEKEREFRWSTKLSTILNKKVINMSSQGGSSMYAISFKTIADIYDLLKRGYVITDAVIQITSPFRLSIFSDVTTEPLNDEFGYRAYNLTSVNAFLSDGEKLKAFATAFFNAESPVFNIYRWYHELFMLKSTLQSMCPNLRIVFVDSLFYKKTIWPSDISIFDLELEKIKRTENNHILDFKKEFDDSLELSMLDLVGDDEELVTSGFHFTKEVHDRFAKHLAEKYFNE